MKTETWRLKVHRSISGYRIIHARRPHHRTLDLLEVPNHVLEAVQAETRVGVRGRIKPEVFERARGTATKRWGRGWYWTVEVDTQRRGC